MVCLPTFLKKERTHHQFLNHVFWLSREIENQAFQGLKNPKNLTQFQDSQKWDAEIGGKKGEKRSQRKSLTIETKMVRE
jgi:hypothetical protein